jgi:hypothetical protein
MTMRRFSAVVLGLVLAAVFACGGGDDDAGQTVGPTTAPAATQDGGGTASVAPADGGGAAGVDVCELLTQEEVEAALGQAASAPQPGASGPYEACTWNTVEISLKFVILQVHGGVSREQFLSQKDETAAFLDTDVTDVEGVGDAAYDLDGFLYAHQGDFELVLTNILGLDQTDPGQAAQALEINRTLMNAALGRLP